jgi:hypothetical protein
MEEIQCCHCGQFVPKSPRHKEQNYCGKPKCQRARKAAWKRKKMRDDPEYRLNHQASNKVWFEAQPGYWKRYRKKNPKKAERNRMLQKMRNKRRLKRDQEEANGSLIAKVDALKVYISEIPDTYQ